MTRFGRISGVAATLAILAAGSAAVAQDQVLEKIPQNATAFVVLKDVTALEGKLSDVVRMFMPQAEDPAMPPPEAPKLMTQMLAEFVGKPELVRPGSPVAIILRFEKLDEEPAVGVLLDLADFKALVGDAQPDADGIYRFDENKSEGYCAQYAGLVLVGKQPAVMTFKKAAAGVKLAAAQKELWTGNDGFAFISLTGLVRSAGPLYEAFRAKLAAELKNMEGATDNPPAPEALAAAKQRLASLEALWGYAGELDWAAAGAALDKSAGDLRLAIGVKPGGKFAACLGGHPPLGQKLSPPLPDVEGWCAVWYSIDGQKVVNGLLEMLSIFEHAMKMEPRIAVGQEGIDPQKMFAALRKIYQENAELVGPGGAAVVSSGPRALVEQGLAVLKVKDSQTYRAKTEQYVKTMKERMKEFLPAGKAEAAGTVEATYERDATKVGEMSVDRMRMKLTLPAPPAGVPGAPDPQALLKMLYGTDDMTVWYAFEPEHVLMVFGADPEPLAKLAAALKGGEDQAESRAATQVRKYMLPEANVAGMVSLSGLMQKIFAATVSAMGATMPEVAPAREKTVISLALSQDRVLCRMRMPLAEAKQIAASGEAMQRVMMERMREQMQQREREGEQEEKPDKAEGAPPRPRPLGRDGGVL